LDYKITYIEQMENDKKFLLRAVEIALNGIKSNGGPFGAVITMDGEIISEAYNKVVLSSDPTAHAEVLAIRQAASVLNSHILDKCTLYTSCEPCPMCLGAIYWAGIKKVVYACDRIDAEAAGFSDKLIYEEISLSPENRKISFTRISDAGGREVFRSWDCLEDKIPY
jgi:guanine deaminase